MARASLTYASPLDKLTKGSLGGLVSVTKSLTDIALMTSQAGPLLDTMDMREFITMTAKCLSMQLEWHGGEIYENNKFGLFKDIQTVVDVRKLLVEALVMDADIQQSDVVQTLDRLLTDLMISLRKAV